MEMNVEYALECIRAVVLNYVELGCSSSFQHCPRYPRQSPTNGLRRIITKFIESPCWFFGDHQRMARTRWIDIQKCEYQVVLVYLVAWNLPLDDLSEDGGIIFHIPHPEVRIASATNASPTNLRASTISVFMTDEVSVRLIPVSFISLTSSSDFSIDDPEEIADANFE